MNWIDSTILWLSPEAGLRRIAARRAAEQLAYEGAKVGRRTSGWNTANTSANTEIGASLTKLRERSRDLVRNTPYGARAINELVGQTIGTGITAQARASAPKLNAAIDAAWEAFCEECDADGQLEFSGIQELIARTMFEAGECLIRFRPRPTGDGFRIPLQLQVLEPEFLDLGKTGTLDTGYIISGVEFDFVGRRQAYWIFPEHPGDTVKTSRFGNLFSRRIPASEIVHVYRKMRAPQVRGVPILAPVIVSIRDLDEYQDAERMRKKIEACLVAMFKQPLGPDGPTAGALATDAQGNKIEQFQPGMVMYGTPGMEADFFAPTGAGGYSEYVRQNERIIAAGVGLTYEKLTGDLTQVNYSSYRAGDMSFRRGVEQFNYNCFIPGCLKPIRRRFIDAAFAVGAIPELEYSTEWTPPAFGSVDPEKDANAAMVDMQIGRATWPQVVAEQGYDPHKQIEEIKKWKPELEAAGVTFTGGKNAGNNQNQVAKN